MECLRFKNNGFCKFGVQCLTGEAHILKRDDGTTTNVDNRPQQREKQEAAGAAGAAGDADAAGASTGGPTAAATPTAVSATAASSAGASPSDTADAAAAAAAASTGGPATATTTTATATTTATTSSSASGTSPYDEIGECNYLTRDIMSGLKKKKATYFVGFAVDGSEGRMRRRPMPQLEDAIYVAPLTTVGNLPFRRVVRFRMFLAPTLYYGAISTRRHRHWLAE